MSLALNPGLTHAILISLLRDNHDPEREREEEPNTHWLLLLLIFFFQF